MRLACGHVYFVQRRLLRENCSNFRYLTFINVISYLNADCFPYFCIAILQNNLKHYIMIRTIFEFETNLNAVLFYYPAGCDTPSSAVCRYLGYCIRASIFYKGFEVYKNPFAPISRFSSLKEARNYIKSEYNKINSLFYDN